jgi:hypothetical protein
MFEPYKHLQNRRPILWVTMLPVKKFQDVYAFAMVFTVPFTEGCTKLFPSRCSCGRMPA